MKTYTYPEAAERLRIGESTLRHWVSQGRISHHKLGSRVRFTDEDLEAALKPTPALPRIVRRRTRRR